MSTLSREHHSHLTGPSIFSLTDITCRLSKMWSIVYLHSMGRLPRQYLTPGSYHCLNRGVKRERIFLDAEDYELFQTRLLKGAEQNCLTVRAYCLLPNHWHIVLECLEIEDMSVMFKNLLNWHTRHHHTKYRTIGHGPIYQGRYKAFYIRNESSLGAICQYVELNAVRAGLVAHPEDWQWSSKGTVR